MTAEPAIKKIFSSSIEKGLLAVWALAFVICFAAVLFGINYEQSKNASLEREFEAANSFVGEIDKDETAKPTAITASVPENKFPAIFARLIFLFVVFGFLIFFCGNTIVQRKLKSRETCLAAFLSALYISGAVFARQMSAPLIPAAAIMPTALAILLPSILVKAHLALALAVILPLGAFLTGSFDAPSYIFAFISGIIAAYSISGAQKRQDLLKAGVIAAGVNLAAMAAVLLWQNAPFEIYAQALFLAAINGIGSGVLALGFLPPLEQALNAATPFRLIELSDLNLPVIRQLFTSSPGTYSHSLIVANLAETAAGDIGANALLSRVGSYYHDLGKMENPEFFVENQGDYNIHDNMDPAHSAAAIRNHVKLGVEKARQLKLPEEVIDIIGEHHGNSVITCFYFKALNQNIPGQNSVNIDDYLYTGSAPRSKESAVVMLADVAEAAARTINKPTAQKLEKFIGELISKKMEQGQLSKAELTFSELQVIKNAFVRVLSSYCHTRIEYPNIDLEKMPSGETGAPL